MSRESSDYLFVCPNFAATYLKGKNGGFEPATNGLYASSGVFFKYIIWKYTMWQNISNRMISILVQCKCIIF